MSNTYPTDNAVQSVVWSATESTVTIIAASIPILRKFLKEKISSFATYIPGAYGSSGKSRRTGQSAGESEARRGSVPLSRISVKHDTLKADTRRPSSHEVTDDESSKSILSDVPLPGQALTTREFPEDKSYV